MSGLLPVLSGLLLVIAIVAFTFLRYPLRYETRPEAPRPGPGPGLPAPRPARAPVQPSSTPAEPFAYDGGVRAGSGTHTRVLPAGDSELEEEDP